MPIYRTNGVWGAGIGVNLTPAQVDGNFYELRTDLDDVIANPPTANSIETIEASGFYWTVTLTDGTELDPLPIPVVQFRWRGDWAPFTLYDALDTFRVDGEGIFSVLQDHTSAATFDAAEAGGSPLALFYNQLIGVASLPADTAIGDLNDVLIDTIGNEDFLVYDFGQAQWTNRTVEFTAELLAPLIELDDLGDVVAPSPSVGQVLTWTGSPATWQPADVAASLDDLSDVSVPAPDDGDVLTYQAGSPTGWIASPPAAVPTTLDALSDVTAPSPADGDFLQYQAGSPTGWVNGAGTPISGLSAATLPLLSTDLIEVSEGIGSPISSYESRKATIGDLGFTLGSTAIALASTVTTVAGLTLSGGTLSGATTLFGMTPGAVLFAGASSVLSEDGTNLFWDGANKRLGIGTAAPDTILTVSKNSAALPAPLSSALHLGGADADIARVTVDGFGGHGAFITRRANNTAASPSAVLVNNSLFVLAAQGFGATGYSGSQATILMQASENWTDSAYGSHILFQTTPIGSTAVANRLFIANDGKIGIQNTSPQSDLHIGATASTARIYNSFPSAINGEWAYLGSWHTAGVATFGPDKNGTGTYRPGRWVSGGVTIWDSLINGDFRIGTGSAIATNATGGFVKIPTCAGTPTGVPGNAAIGSAEVVYDSVGKKLWIYDNGTTSWKGVVVA